MTAPEVESSRRRTRVGLFAIAILAFATAVIHLPRINRPFGTGEVNAGAYFGLFVKQFEQFGFAELRGMPIAAQRVLGSDALDQPHVKPYVNHPPGMTWAAHALGGDEWAFRLPAVIAGLLGVISLFFLLSPATGPPLALLATLALVGLPSVSLFSLASYETTAMGLGLVLWLATSRVDAARGARRIAWRGAQIGACLAGTWADWSFAFWCVGLAVLCWPDARSSTGLVRGIPGDALRTLWRLRVPAIASILAAAAVVVWQSWALANPLLGERHVPGFAEMIDTNILGRRPAVIDFLAGAWRHVTMACSVPLVVIGGLGMPALLRGAPRLGPALLAAGTLQPLAFAEHARTHVHFWCFTGALLIAGAAALAASTARRARAAALAATAILTGCCWWSGYAARNASDTTFQRDLGRFLDAATRNPGPDGMLRRSYRVATNYPFVYAYYVESPHVIVPCFTDAANLFLQRSNPLFAEGYRYLWFRAVTGPAAGDYCFRTAEQLEMVFAELPGRRVAELERSVGALLQASEVKLVQVPPIGK